jgi:hypothetical protein
MNQEDYIKQLEEAISKQANLIDSLKRANEGAVKEYNKLVEDYNEIASMLNACGVRRSVATDGKTDAWALTMQIGAIPDPQTPLKEKGIDTSVTKWTISPV